ncbi:hypothetical protein ACY05_00965 [Sterolibacterium denitrificans]|nr:chemotaxis protein CheD [Sterolibacterium denitrificans]KYC29547.1 hypothetical protein ACY05_00965 [Sterolibacterium denitrificans]
MASNDTASAPINLAPGEFHFCAAPAQLGTLLGSCVTITLWHPRRQLGGMCHILLPGAAPRIAASTATPALDGRYAEAAFALFDAAITRHGSRPREYQARLFGGGNMFPAMKTFSPLGRQNIEAARAFLETRRIPLLEEHTGGTGRRKLLFDLDSGEVRLQYADPQKR